MYTFPFCRTVITNFLDTHPRGWVSFRQIFYCRKQTLIIIFSKNQFLWNKIKRLIKKLENYEDKCDIPPSGLLEQLIDVSSEFREIWELVKSYDQETDELDYLLYRKRKSRQSRDIIYKRQDNMG